MAGPWEKYQKQSRGPWTKYQSPADNQAVQQNEPSAASDIVASFASGAGRGTADLLGLPGTVSDLSQGALQWGLSKAYGLATGHDPDPHSESGIERFFAGPSPEVQKALLFGGKNPISGETLRSGLSTVTGGATDYQPYTTAGKYARTAGEFLPGAMAGGGTSVGNVVRMGLIPAASSEAAGQATEGTWAEPFARVAGALAGGAIGSRLSPSSAERVPSASEIKQAAGYDALKAPMKAAQVDRPSYESIIKNLWDEANDFGLTTKLKGEVSGTLSDFAKRAKSGGSSLYDLEVLRRSLRNIGGDKLDNASQALSAKLVDSLDSAVENLSATNISSSGEAGKPILDVLKEARETYRTGIKSQMVEDAIQRAQSAASGVENGLRNEFRKLVNNPKLARNFTATEREAIRNVAEGNFTTNALRWLGTFGVPIDQGRNFLGSLSGGGVGAAIGGFLGGPAGATIGGFALPAAGTMAKMASSRSTNNLAEIAEALIKGGPQEQSAFSAAQAARQVAGREAVLRALLQGQSAARIPYAREPAR